VREGKVTSDAARSAYGVLLGPDGRVDEPGTGRVRRELMDDRRDRSVRDAVLEGPAVDVGSASRLDENLVLADDAGTKIVACGHCGQRLGDPRVGPDLLLARYDGPAAAGGPQVTADPADYVDDEIVFRQYCCPGCYTALYSSIVPADHADHVSPLSRLLPVAGAGAH
jgi:N-methylhydantoinase B